MDGSGHQLLPGTALPPNQHGRVGVGNPRDLPLDRLDGRAGADQLALDTELIA